MKKAAVFLAEGYEEGESLFLTDILRRAGFKASLISVDGSEYVKGAHDIVCKADKELDDEVKDYDMIILPGGMPGALNLRDNEKVIEMVKHFDKAGKFIGAICAAPIVLEKAGVSKGRKLTSYPADKYRKLFVEADYKEEIVVIDKNLITSRGPASTMDFAYAVVDLLGKDSADLKEKMLYNMVKGI